MFFSRFHVKQLIALSRLLFADATIRAFQAVADCLMAVKINGCGSKTVRRRRGCQRAAFLVPAKHPAAIPAEDTGSARPVNGASLQIATLRVLMAVSASAAESAINARTYRATTYVTPASSALAYLEGLERNKHATQAYEFAARAIQIGLCKIQPTRSGGEDHRLKTGAAKRASAQPSRVREVKRDDQV